MRILLVDNGSNLLPKLQKLIPDKEVTVTSDGIESINEYDLIVLSGGPHNVSEDFNKEIDAIKSGKPIIGICFGCELIASTFGGEIKELPEEQKGIYEITLEDAKLGGPKKIKVYEGHKKFISKVPKEFEVLAKSEKGPEIIKHKNLPIYGLQFYPENLVDETDGDELFLNLLKQF